jgi:hypothetical protein
LDSDLDLELHLEQYKFLPLRNILNKCTTSKAMDSMCTEEFWYTYWRSKPQSLIERIKILLQMVSRTYKGETPSRSKRVEEFKASLKKKQ